MDPILPPYGPESMMWKVNRERIVLLAGPAAATLQAAHPQVAEGVANHSSYRDDPIKRLTGTLDATYGVAFGSEDDIQKIRLRIAEMHKRVQGPGYSAFDQDAQLWVLATLTLGSIAMYSRFIAPLNETERDRLWAENLGFGTVFGYDPSHGPTTWKEFTSYWHSMVTGDILGSNPLSREIVRTITHPPQPFWLRLMSPVLSRLTTELVPESLHKRLGLRRVPTQAVLWKGLEALLPVALSVLPPEIRFDHRYLAASKLDLEDPI